VGVRLKDIARDLGVSVVTVSKVLHGHADISSDTRKRVLKRAAELNYRPNLLARSLVTGRSSIIGLIVPDLVHPFFGQIAKALARVLRAEGYSLVISSSETDAELEREEIGRLLERHVDVLIVASTQWSVETFREIEGRGVPYILIDRSFVGLAANFVGVDDEAAGFLATSHLIDVGCKRIAHIGGARVSTAIGRREGFRRALLMHNRAVPPEYIIMRQHGEDPGEDTGKEAVRKFLHCSPPPDGIFCYNDPTAMGAMKAIFEAGLRTPDDIAVVGCGNVIYSDFLRVPLTTIDQQSERVGEEAGALALRLSSTKKPLPPSSILLEPRLVVRESTMRAKTPL
jgi:LacI family transcriptional regulator